MTRKLSKLSGFDKPEQDPEEEIIAGHIVGVPNSVCNEAEPGAIMPNIVPFDKEDGEDDANALRESCRSLEKLEWDEADLKFFFNRAETRMKLNGAKKQYTKFQVLSEIIPKRVQDEVKELLSQSEEEFPNGDAYLQLKTEILRVFGPRPEDAIERALNRVLVGKPSQLAKALVNDVCKQKFNCPCCPAIVGHLWKKQLSSAVRAGIAHCVFDKEHFNETVKLADDIHDNTARPATVAAVAAARSAANADETLPAIPYPEPEVAAIRGGRGGRGNRGFRGGGRGGGGNRGGGQAPASGQPQARRFRGPKHPDLPDGEWRGCALHYKWGRNAHFCAEPSTCPWRNIFTPKQPKQQ